MSDILRSEKQKIRSYMLKKRERLNATSVREAEERLRETVGEFLLREEKRTGRFPSVMSYMSFRNEFPTHSFNRWLLESKIPLILPHTDDDFRIRAFIVKDRKDLKKSRLGIEEPDPERCLQAACDDPDLIIVPGIAFDLQGNRVGFGKGCYDRFLSQRTRPVLCIGAAYSFQVSSGGLPAEAGDFPVDQIVTEKDVLFCRRLDPWPLQSR